MIVIDDKRYIFQHIPKCAGTTLRKWIIDGYGADVRIMGVIDHPETGKVETAHLPLKFTKAIFPEVLEKFRSYQSTAILRDPFDRFVSALGQYLREFHAQNIHLMETPALQKAVSELIQRLRAGDQHRDYRLMHFYTQASFVEDEGERLITTLYPIESVGQAARDIGRILDLNAARVQTQNERKEFRLRAVGAPARAADRMARRVLPEKVWRRSRNIAIARLMKPKRGPADTVFAVPGCRDFVAEHYARDIELYEMVRPQHRKAN